MLGLGQLLAARIQPALLDDQGELVQGHCLLAAIQLVEHRGQDREGARALWVGGAERPLLQGQRLPEQRLGVAEAAFLHAAPRLVVHVRQGVRCAAEFDGGKGGVLIVTSGAAGGRAPVAAAHDA